MRMLIDKIKLRLLLEEKRDYISHSLEGIDVIITAVLYVISLLCSDFKSVFGIDKAVIETLAWVIAVIVFAYGIYKLWKSSRYRYSHTRLFHDIENLYEVLHSFSLVALKDEFNKHANRFLLHYDDSWQCWFFFSFHTSEFDNKSDIIQRLSNTLKVDASDIRLRYITTRIQPKFSEKDKVQKVYQHSLYQASLHSFTDAMKTDEFVLDGTRFRWWTIQEMESDEVIMKKNADVVSFVKEKIM